MTFNRRSALLGTLTAMLSPLPALAQKRYGPGVSDTEIRIGSTLPLSGPVSLLGTLGKTAQAYIGKLNAEGGINGRRVKLIQYDDAYNPGKALELTRRLVEQDEVAFIFGTVGTASNTAIHRYLTARKVPQLLIFSGASKWNDVVNAPLTISGMPTYNAEGRVYARWILDNMPTARIAVLLQNDDFGRDYLAGIKAGLGDKARFMIVAEASYESTDASVDSQIVSLKASGATVFFSLSNGKFTVQSLKKASDLGWKPQVFLPLGSSSAAAIMKPAGPEAGKGAITAIYNKPATNPDFANDAGVVGLREFLKKWQPEMDASDSLVGGGYTSAQILEHILKRCGDDLTRENIMKQASSLAGFAPPLLMPGVALSTSEKDHELYGHLWLQRFDGSVWIPFGKALPV